MSYIGWLKFVNVPIQFCTRRFVKRALGKNLDQTLQRANLGWILNYYFTKKDLTS